MTAIRRMTADDVEAVADLTTQLGYQVDPRTVAERLDRLTGRDDHVVLVATDDADRAVAWIHLAETLTLERDPLVTIHGLVVHEAHRSSGIGAELVAAGDAWARSRGVLAVLVRSRTTREGAHRFYRRLGFDEMKRSVVLERPIE